MTLRLMGKKRGMTRIFDDNGNQVVCTVILAEPNVVTQIKTKEKDDYEAVQLAAFKVKKTRATKPVAGHFAKAGVEPCSHLLESRVDNVADYQVGQEVDLSAFEGVDYVDIQAVSKGKGYQGVMKRHNFSGGPASHGSGFHRHAGSTGMRSTPGRCLPGVKMAGHMGAEVVTTQNLRVVKVDAEKKILLVEGAVPGSRGGVVCIARSIKKANQKKNK